MCAHEIIIILTFLFSQEQVALAIIPKVTSSLSILGSGYITFDVLRPHKVVRSSYQRLLVGMSICDLSMSGGIFMSTWPMPRDVPNVYGNVGTVQTCTAQGFFEQFGVSTVMCKFLPIRFLLNCFVSSSSQVDIVMVL